MCLDYYTRSTYETLNGTELLSIFAIITSHVLKGSVIIKVYNDYEASEERRA